ncbi:MAG: GNAT family N-acetyltransferase [Terracoccus sp.]
MSELQVRDATEADLEAVLTIRSRSFGPLGADGQGWWQRIADETVGGRMLVVVDAVGTGRSGECVLGSGRIRPYQQVWGGRHLPMGGVAGVYVDPVARGRGVASLLGRALVERMAELGDLVSCLYPTAPTLYRGVGYEFGGAQTRFTYAADALRSLRSAGADVNVRAARPEDADRFEALARDHQQQHRLSGPMLASAQTWRSRLADAEMIHYLADDGFVAYSLVDGVLTVESLVARSPGTAAALWSVVGSGSSAAPVVEAWLDPRDPVALVAGAMPDARVHTVPWMLRVVDLAGAVVARGFAPGLTASATVAVTDPDAPANAGTWVIAVSGGRGTAVLQQPSTVPDRTTDPRSSGHFRTAPGPAASSFDAEPVRLEPRGLAALWCGWTLARLRQAGLAAGGSTADDGALDSIFAGQPFMTEYF